MNSVQLLVAAGAAVWKSKTLVRISCSYDAIDQRQYLCPTCRKFDIVSRIHVLTNRSNIVPGISRACIGDKNIIFIFSRRHKT
jgi:hypothetical protein